MILKERLALKSLDVADAAFVDTAVEKIPVTVRMPVRTIDRMSRRRLSLNLRAWARPRA